jgi:hypothetical protein
MPPVVGHDRPVANVASVHCLLGDHDRALELLERCLPRMHAQMIAWARQDRDFAPLHADPRFLALIDGHGNGGGPATAA